MDGTAPARRAFDALRAVLYATAFVGFLAWAALQFRDAMLPYAISLPTWVRAVGLILMLAGGVLASSCVVVLVLHGRGTPAPFDPPRAFVVRGMYRHVRNPMYVGGFVLLLGFALWHRSPGMIAFAFGVSVLLHLFVVLVEEPGLERRFGESYREYKARVNRWLPPLSGCQIRKLEP